MTNLDTLTEAEWEALEVECSECSVSYTGYGHKCETPNVAEQVVIELGKAVYDEHGRVRTSYKGKLGWAWLCHLELDEDQ